MIESMKTIILQNECPKYGTSTKTFFTTIQDFFVNMWDKNYTTLYCLAHSLNLKYHSKDWLNGGPSHRFPPHMDGEISRERKDIFTWIYQDRASLDEVEETFVEFSTGTWRFGSYYVLSDKRAKKPYAWWATHGATCPLLKHLVMRLLSQVTSSFCCERYQSTYGNLCSLKKSKLEQSRAETMVYVHTNLHLIYM